MHLHFIFWVERGGRFVQQDNLCVFQHGTGNGYALLLASGQGTATFANHRVVALRQAHDEVVATGFLGGGNDFLIRRVRLAETDVVAYGVLEQIDILEHHGNVAHQAFGYYFVHRHIAKEDVSLLWVVETGTKFHHGAFPTTRRAYKSRQGVFGERDGYIMQHFLAPLPDFPYLRLQKEHTMKTPITIRQESPQDHTNVYKLIREAFASVEESDHSEQDLVERLRHSSSFIPELSLVAETGRGELTRIRIINDAQTFPSLAVAPLSVLPSCQRQGIGSALIREAHRRAAALGYGSAVLLGHPGYYPRFGYLPAHRFGIRFPIDTPVDCCMVIELQPDGLKGVQGRVEYDPAFGI